MSLQVASLYAATKGHLDEYEPRQVVGWEEELHSHLLASFPSVLEKISAGSKLKEVEEDLKEAIKQHKAGYQDA